MWSFFKRLIKKKAKSQEELIFINYLDFLKRDSRNHLKKKKAKSQEEIRLLEFEESLKIDDWNYSLKFSCNEFWNRIQEENIDFRRNLALAALQLLVEPGFKLTHVRKKIFKSEFGQRNVEYSKEVIQRVFVIIKSNKNQYSNLPSTDIVSLIKYYRSNYGEDRHYRSFQSKISFPGIWDPYHGSDFQKIRAELVKPQEVGFDINAVDTRDILGVSLVANWDNINQETIDVIAHCWNPSQNSRPSKKWMKESKRKIETASSLTEQIKWFHYIFEFLTVRGNSLVKVLNNADQKTNLNFDSPSDITDFDRNKYKYYLTRENEIGISYLIWYSSLINEVRLNSIIGDFVRTSFKKIKYSGCLSTINGNACLYGFTLMSAEIGVNNLQKIRDKATNKNIKKQADKYLKLVAKELDLTEETLLEHVVPSFNLYDGFVKQNIGDYIGRISVLNIKKPKLDWVRNKDERTLKTIPNTVKQDHKDELEEIKLLLKNITSTYQVNAKRLENTYLTGQTWPIKKWKSYYVDHSLLSRFGSLLIWWFDEKVCAINFNGTWIDEQEKPINIDSYSEVKLWHPVYSSSDVVLRWREFLVKNEIIQAFKQAFREIYIVTEAEIESSTYSNRFAAHIIYQHQFLKLARLRNWDYTLQGGFDSFNTPTKLIPKYNLKVEYDVFPFEGSLNDFSIYGYLTSDKVKFIYENELVLMNEIPSIVFTEIMRDVDLFVGVCSIGNNPEWRETGETGNYWDDYSFGDLNATAVTRKEALEFIIPKLKIASQCKLDGKFLVVKGQLRTYKIHLGSGNILMSPRDQYLCIVPKSVEKRTPVFLPFDDDRMLSIIISKAFLLSEDSKITDNVIVKQIK